MPTSQLIPQGFACALLLSPCLSCSPSYRQQTHQTHTAESTHQQVATHTHFTHRDDSLELEVSEELHFVPLPSDSLPPTPLRSLLPREKGWSLHYYSKQVARHQGSRHEATDEHQQAKVTQHQEQVGRSTTSARGGFRRILLQVLLSLSLLLGVGYIYRRAQR
ncbi:hypothetical protein [Porphyromonas sp. oral taxon 278]|uniref:hypothetical protein n=1 Tax=Porphyromonas sp. oral taxon 278 TaxID=712437 RepID=UPI0012EDFF6B|nr:hypothetical protein [Porphyromonas sp. oral taxon 278]